MKVKTVKYHAYNPLLSPLPRARRYVSFHDKSIIARRVMCHLLTLKRSANQTLPSAKCQDFAVSTILDLGLLLPSIFYEYLQALSANPRSNPTFDHPQELCHVNLDPEEAVPELPLALQLLLHDLHPSSNDRPLQLLTHHRTLLDSHL